MRTNQILQALRPALITCLLATTAIGCGGSESSEVIELRGKADDFSGNFYIPPGRSTHLTIKVNAPEAELETLCASSNGRGQVQCALQFSSDVERKLVSNAVQYHRLPAADGTKEVFYLLRVVNRGDAMANLALSIRPSKVTDRAACGCGLPSQSACSETSVQVSNMVRVNDLNDPKTYTALWPKATAEKTFLLGGDSLNCGFALHPQFMVNTANGRQFESPSVAKGDTVESIRVPWFDTGAFTMDFTKGQIKTDLRLEVRNELLFETKEKALILVGPDDGDWTTRAPARLVLATMLDQLTPMDPEPATGN